MGLKSSIVDFATWMGILICIARHTPLMKREKLGVKIWGYVFVVLVWGTPLKIATVK